MVKTNIQTFTGEVEILSNLHVGSYLTANGDASNVLDVTGNVGASFFVGDGGLISNIATTLSDIVNQGNLVSNVVQFNAPPAAYAGVGIVTASNVGIQNSNPLNTLSIADKIIIDKDVSEPSTTMNVHGKVYASRFEGDGGLLSNIATTLEAIINQGNVSANVVKFSSATDYAGAGLVTDSNVGIQNTAPVFNLSVGSNVHIDDEGSNVLTVHGNVSASNLNLGVFTVSASHGLDQVCAESNVVARPVRFSNVITAISAVSNIESAGTFISTDAERGIDVASNIDIGGRLKFDSNVFIDTLRVADVAANIVTYDRTTGELLDSSGTFMNKFAVVSEQPPSDFFANTTTVTNHGSYTLTTSNLATNSNTYNAFDGTANAWVSGDLAGGYIGGSNVFHENNLTQLSNLHPTQHGDWLAIEFPYKTTLRHMKLTPLTREQFPEKANLYATNNDLTWTEINYWSGRDPVTASNVQTITVNATEQFKKYALVATKAVGSSNVAIQDWQLFTESFSIDGGKVAMAQQAATGGETVMDQHGPHVRGVAPLKKFPEIVFDASKLDGNDTTNTYVQAGYTVSTDSVYQDRQVYRAFSTEGGKLTTTTHVWSSEDIGGNGYLQATGEPVSGVTFRDENSTIYTGHYIKLELPKKIKLNSISFKSQKGDYNSTNNDKRPTSGTFLGSTDGTNWVLLKTFNESAADALVWSGGLVSTNEYLYHTTLNNIVNDGYFSYIIFLIETIGNSNSYGPTEVRDLKYYGYEEDPPLGDTSVDTTFTSIMNTPQTTEAQVYVDGSLGETFTNRVVGPTVSNTHTTYVSTEKYWELSGNVESNVTLEANTFLSGDAPHSLSMWFNSSNLEANVSNSCIFSLATEEKLDHVGVGAYQLLSNTYQTEQKIGASDAAGGDLFGYGQALFKGTSMSGDGSVFVVGAVDNDDGVTSAGSVYIYIKDGSNWTEVQKLVASSTSGQVSPRFGSSVRISEDGNYIIVGEPRNDTIGTNRGAARVFVRTAGTNIWTEMSTILRGSDSTNEDDFGTGVAISSDGTYAVATSHEYPNQTRIGAAYVFKRTGTSWSAHEKLQATDPATQSYFGNSVAISGDGNYILVGAYLEDTDGTDSGAAYVFNRTGTNSWGTGFKIKASDDDSSDRFGSDVSLSRDGTYALIGAYGDKVGTATSYGSAYIYTRSGTNTWGTEKKIRPSTYDSSTEHFGMHVAMSYDGTHAIIGSADADTGVGNEAGAVYIFTRSGSDWTQKVKTWPRSGVAAGDHFGGSVSISADGSYFVTGAWGDTDPATSAGSAYVFTRDKYGRPGSPAKLKLQSNTWHNLTYAYQGEGGSRVTYLDGRKVAEDQAEDTFGEYPPFAMTGYSQGGYVVSQSSLRSGHQGWHAFEKTNTGTFKYASDVGGGDTFGGTDTAYNGINRLSSSTPLGAWLKIELPHKIRLQYTSIAASGSTEQAEDFGIYGSNDDNTWDQLFQKTGATATSDYVDYVINATSCYKYFAILVTKLISSTTILAIDEWKLYGHRENDLVRLPDPTNVLKYPDIYGNFSGYAQRGYIVSDSAHNLSAKRFGWELFNGDSQWQAFSVNGQSAALQGYDTTGDFNANTSAPLHTADGVNYYGHWVKIKMPRKIKVSQIYFKAPTGTGGTPDRVAFLVSNNDGSTWSTLLGNTALTVSDGERYLTPSDTTNYWQTFLFIATSKNGNVNLVAHALAYIGTEEATPIPLQIGGGNIDKVANFRVYDKFIGEDQALEIWDAQKDEFGRAKSSMTLQKGRLGLGTTEPEGRLAVLDEPHNLEEFPPRAMTGYKNYFEGHGEFCVINSTFQSGGQEGWKAFNGVYGVPGNGDAWLSGNPTYNLDGTSNGTSSINGEAGEYLILEMPYNVKMKNVLVYPRGANSTTASFSNPPKNGKIWGKNGIDSVWEELTEYSNLDFGAIITDNVDGQYPQKIQINALKAYKYIAFQVQVSNHALSGTKVYTNIRALRYFGTREQGQSVLHDGQLTLTKNLNVPRIGPALDADDTPRRDRLVVEYNTSTNPTFEGAVRDTSGMGNDGVFYSGATYDATQKAFDFDGTDDYVRRETLPGFKGGNITYGVSMWIKLKRFGDANGSSVGYIYTIGNVSSPGEKTFVYCRQQNTGENPTYQLLLAGYSYDFPINKNDWALNTWYHIVTGYDGTTFNGTNLQAYVDGVSVGTLTDNASNGGDAGAQLNIAENPRLTLAKNDSEHFSGYISNFKLYDTPLTASEVKTLYNMGRTGSVANPQPLHIAAPLYSPGTIVQVDQAFTNNMGISTTSTSATDITGLSITIQPKFANSKILVSYQLAIGSNYHAFVHVKRTQNGVTSYDVGRGASSSNRTRASSFVSHVNGAHICSENMEFLDSANGIDPITYQIQMWVASTSYTFILNRSITWGNSVYSATLGSSLTVKEICQ